MILGEVDQIILEDNIERENVVTRTYFFKDTFHFGL